MYKKVRGTCKVVVLLYKTGDLINANFAFKNLYRQKQKFSNKGLYIQSEL